ncbi:transcriptional regulator, ArsR family [Shimia gijangensis]|uniref:Transcriptional regulator, ArsR family n=1 Tax=Shimia gijangensis TaxID=1470563 RepID=A0A1M6QPK4_9RHOB|nr:metalloregulator ArsR/SmtB family transcription factor [Shimia gijangensis]SHK22023.1 transcriptional regulator, ArsR family [Shimia gijangensis]
MTTLVNTFAALADDTRLGIIERLMADGEQPAGDLVARSTISGPAISRHLKILREAGLIAQRTDGNRRLYAVRPEAMQAIANWTMDHRRFWEAGLDRLDAMLSEESHD